MGYLIKDQIRKAEITLTGVEVASLDITPIAIMNFVNYGDNYSIIAANIKIVDFTTQIIGFGHIYLSFGGPTLRAAIYDENNGMIYGGGRNNFIINMSHPPNQFGSFTPYGGNLDISSELPPTILTGSGDITVTIYYMINF